MIENIYIGKDSISNLSEILKLHSGKKVFLVTGKSSYEKSGAQKIMESVLKGTPYFRFSDFEENPKLEDVEKGIELFKRENCELTIAIGGGSAIDIAKLINSLSKVEENLIETIKANRLDQKPYPFVAIPTTAGTGSEATHFAVMYINGEKYSFAHKDILPEYVIVDSQFTYSTPAYLTACTGADALCQAIESMWATGGNAESKEYAEKAIQLVWKNLKRAVVDNDKDAKDKVSEGAYWAGKAINISKTTGPHAFSYIFTSKFGLPHGHAVALTIVEFFRFNFFVTDNDCADPRGYEYVNTCLQNLIKILEASDIEEAASKLQSFFKEIGIELDFFSLGIDIRNNYSEILESVNVERLKNNPRLINVTNAKKILCRAL